MSRFPELTKTYCAHLVECKTELNRVCKYMRILNWIFGIGLAACIGITCYNTYTAILFWFGFAVYCGVFSFLESWCMTRQTFLEKEIHEYKEGIESLN